MIRFHQVTTLVIVESYDEASDRIIEQVEKMFKPGMLIDADIVSEENERVELQFGHGGGVAFNVPRTCFDVIPDCR
jgi:exosome complex RNA-binding protein Csl4